MRIMTYDEMMEIIYELLWGDENSNDKSEK